MELVDSPVLDQALWDRCVTGDRDAFSEIFRRHRDLVYNYCFRRTASWDAAEDLTSTVFLEVWRTRKALILEGGSAAPWLIGTASNLVRSRLRSAARRSETERRGATDERLDDLADGIADRVDAERRMAAVLEAVRDLSQAEQEVVAACVFAEMDYASAAAALGVAVGTVRSRLSRARAHLRGSSRIGKIEEV
ncbi:RNA polymerase sigma factor [Sinomonas albida]|uniref:RNA polymerase sigma factor n=1 Tax=Sinomonas albida TaxID=369942 RepID=UPI0010A7DB98|nr:sigma-70 family RNA polymerase sigma factor [Sinomonas albida]